MAQTKPAGGKEWGQIIFIVNMWHLQLLMVCWMAPGWLAFDLFISFTLFFLWFVGSLKSYRWNGKGLKKGKSLQAFKCVCDYSAEERWQTVVIWFISRRKYDEISELRGFFFTCHTWLFCVYLIGTSLLQQIIEGEYSVESKEGLGFNRKMNCICNKPDCWVPTMSLELPMISCFRSWGCDLEGLGRECLCTAPSHPSLGTSPCLCCCLPCPVLVGHWAEFWTHWAVIWSGMTATKDLNK